MNTKSSYISHNPCLLLQLKYVLFGRYVCENGINYGNQNQANTVKGCGMGPWLVLVSPCFRKNVVATCKIGSFLCSLDNLL